MSEDRSVRVTVDRRRCVGSSLCVTVSSGLFVIEGGKSRFIGPTDARERIQEAVDNCPVGAIVVEQEDKTGRKEQ